MVQVGKKAPAFSLPNADGKKVSLKDYAGKHVVLYFYPRDNTPGCTIEAQDFQRALPEFKKRKAVVLGVSPDDGKSHCKFRDKFELAFDLLSDPEHAIIEKYGAWGEKSLYGKKSMGVIRSTVIVDPSGNIQKVFPKVRVAGHIDAVIAALDE